MKKIKNFLKTDFNLYYYDKDNLDFKRIKIRYMIILLVLMLSIHIPLIIKDIMIGSIYESEISTLNTNDTIKDFTEDKLIQLIDDLNIKFPYIVLAQAKLETGHFKSKIFRENHNLFGMKQSKVRINIARGTRHNHAYYDNWCESVYDYAFYQSTYLSKIKTEEEYFSYLQNSYAESTDYVDMLKVIIEKENLKKLF